MNRISGAAPAKRRKKKDMMKTLITIPFIFLSGMRLPGPAQAGEVKITDSRHFSTVLGEVRNFRVFLPPGYEESPETRYPVIYFFHGWSQRYFGVTMGDGYDRGDENGGDTIARFVSGHDVIVVKWDGFNIRDGDEYYLRPYNISPVETFRQFPLYFPELVRTIDSRYRTIPDREHRAVSGLSMGGFMTFWIGGKYPDLVCAAGNFCGSPEFFVGPKAFPVEYRHIDMYKNYGGMRLRLNFGTDDFIRAYHRDMNRIFPHIMDNYEYGIYEAAHSTCGLGEMFGFIMRTFENPPEKPETWHHIDVYPVFSVWGYDVTSDRTVPGFTILENVNIRGFRSSVREFLPDGGIMPSVTVTVTTAPVYGKETAYLINDMNLTKNHATQYLKKSDKDGKLTFAINGYTHDIGITEQGGIPNLSVGSFRVENMPWVVPLKNVEISVSILNKGGSAAEGVRAELQATRKDVTVLKGKAEFGNIRVNEIKSSAAPFTFSISADSIDAARFKLVLKDGGKREWTDWIYLPILADGPEFTDIEIADGRECTVAEAGTTKTTLFLGAGNGDGIANPGESIEILVRDEASAVHRRTLAYTPDDSVNPNGVHRRMSDNWGRLDHVGGSAKVSEPLISSGCPDGRILTFFTEYWLPDNPDHRIRRGIARIRVTGKDTTPPRIGWLRVHGDNTIQAHVFDGGTVEYVKATLRNRETTFRSFPHNDFEVMLNDDGVDGDTIRGDNVFSLKIPERNFGLYTVEIEAGDVFNNTGVKAFPDIFTVH